jgi:protein TonB
MPGKTQLSHRRVGKIKAMMRSSFRHDLLLAVFIILSLLLHLLLLYVVPADRLVRVSVPRKPVVVEVRPPQPSLRELDVPPAAPAETRQKPAQRQAPADRVAPRETAPRGDAPEDRRPVPPADSRPAATPAQRPVGDAGPAPSPEALDLGLSKTTQERLQKGWANKYRKDVQEGEAVWLDTEKDLLASFFKRFRDNIYQVWNYPRQAAERGESGVCLLRIVINRDGSVETADVLESSGYPTLDREAVAAVYRGASYGNLPSSFPKDQLTIMAYFQYRLSRGELGRDIFGR